MAAQIPTTNAPWVPNARATRLLERDPDYAGPLAHKPPEEVAYLLKEALEYFELPYRDRPPLPLDHGWGMEKLPDNLTASAIWHSAMIALHEMAEGKPRALRSSWRELGRIIMDARRDAREEGRQEARSIEKAVRRQARRRAPMPWVYFIGGEHGHIKIGYSVNPEKRLSLLRTSSPHRLEIIARTQGGQALEAEYHRRFAEARLAGEWFSRAPAILAEIARLNQGATA